MMVVAGVGVPRDCYFQKNYVTTNAGPRVSNTKTLMALAKNIPARSSASSASRRTSRTSANGPATGAAGWIKRKGGEAKIIAFDPGSLDATSLVLQAMEFKPDVITRLDAQGPGGADLRRRRGTGPDRQGALDGSGLALQPDLPAGDQQGVGRQGLGRHGAQRRRLDQARQRQLARGDGQVLPRLRHPARHVCAGGLPRRPHRRRHAHEDGSEQDRPRFGHRGASQRQALRERHLLCALVYRRRRRATTRTTRARPRWCRAASSFRSRAASTRRIRNSTTSTPTKSRSESSK